jgi:hypothetical protein
MFSGENKYYIYTLSYNKRYQLTVSNKRDSLYNYALLWYSGCVGKYDVQKGHDWTQKQGDDDSGLEYKRVDRYG